MVLSSQLFKYLFGTFVIGLVTFGGGAVFIPMFQDLFVNRMGITDTEFYNLIVSLATSLPGALGPKIAGYFGYGLFGWWIFIPLYMVFILPGVVLMVFNYKALVKLKDSKRFKIANDLLKAVIAAILMSIVYGFLFGNMDKFPSILMTIYFFAAMVILQKKWLKVHYLIVIFVTVNVIIMYLTGEI